MAYDKDRLENYVPVADRLQEFWKTWEHGRIQTTIVEHDQEKGFVVIKAWVYKSFDDAEPSASGHAFEERGAGPVNRTSYIENCETSAVGRALANLGIAVDKGIASREEMQKVERMNGAPAQAPAPQAYATTAPPGGADQWPPKPAPADKATPAQMKFLNELARDLNEDLEMRMLLHMNAGPDELTKTQASDLITLLKELPRPEAPVAAPVAATPLPANSASGPSAATKPQLSALAKIAESTGVALTALVEQQFPGLNPEQLSKQQASHLIQTYGAQKA